MMKFRNANSLAQEGKSAAHPWKTRYLASWSVFAVALFIAVLAGIAIVRLQTYSDNERIGQVQLAHLHEETLKLGTGEWEALAFPNRLQEVSEEVKSDRNQCIQLMQRLQALDTGDDDDYMQQLKKALDSYLTATQQQFQLLESGHYAAARVLDDQQVNPAFDKLNTKIDAVSRDFEEDAAAANAKADIDTFVALILGAAILGVLFLGFERSQRKAAVLQSEQQALATSEERFRLLIQNSTDIIAILNVDGTFRYVSEASMRVWGHLPDALIGVSPLELVHKEDADKLGSFLEQVTLGDAPPDTMELRLRHANGSWLYCEITASNLLRTPGIEGLVLTLYNISRRKRMEQSLLSANAVLENAVEGIAELDRNGHYRTANHAYAQKVGYTPEEMVGMTWQETFHVQERALLADAFREVLDKGKVELETRGLKQDGSFFHSEVTLIVAYDAAGAFRSYHCFMKDISERKTLEEKIAHQAFHDALCGLPNRVLFTDRVHQALARAQRQQSKVAVLFLDLDNFKLVNDTLGHEEGDRLLVTVAQRLKGCVRPGDTVARMGGDEFTLLLEDVSTEEGALLVAKRIIECLRAPVRLATHDFLVTGSIGIALSSDSCCEVESLLRDADTAMYQAKLAGKAGYALFDNSMNARMMEHLEIETGLRRALEQDELRVLYQPIINLTTGEISGAEALVRWAHPTLGLVSPARFIPIAEETGLIVPLGAWVLREACRQAQAWQNLRGENRHFMMSVNLSGKQLQRPDIVQTVADILQETGLNPACLQLEITESMMLTDLDNTIQRLDQLKALGVLLAIDDFGTGYSSLASLQKLPVDTVKIDRAFINVMGQESQPTAVVEAIISLCRAMNLKVVSEGVEKRDQLVQLQALGCDAGQGYYFDKPIPDHDFQHLLEIGRVSSHQQEDASIEILLDSLMACDSSRGGLQETPGLPSLSEAA